MATLRAFLLLVQTLNALLDALRNILSFVRDWISRSKPGEDKKS